MPTPNRTVRIADDVWFSAQKRADEHGETITDVLVRALKSYASGPSWQERALAAEAEVERLQAQIQRT